MRRESWSRFYDKEGINKQTPKNKGSIFPTDPINCLAVPQNNDEILKAPDNFEGVTVKDEL